VRHEVFLGVRHVDHADIPPAFWNLLCSLTAALFRGLIKVARKLKVEAPGHEQEHVLFRELPQLLLGVVLEVATWWWSFDRGFLGTSLRCPTCGATLKYEGDVEKEMVTPFGVIRPRRAYYRCPGEGCDTSVWPLDRRLGLTNDSFLPCTQEIVVWLTSLDPYGKCLQFVAKLLHFTICHRSAWLITQKFGRLVKEREDEAIRQAFDNPANPVFPAAELPSPAVGVVMFDGTCGRIDKDEEPQPVESDEEDPDAPSKPPDFCEVKLGLAGHLVPPVGSSGRKSRPPAVSAGPSEPPASNSSRQKSNKRKRRRKVRPQGEEPTIAHKKLAVHLGRPLRLFQLMLLLVHRLGLDKAKTLLVIGDGAKWIWCGVREHLSSLGVEVIEILDYFHATEHLWKLANSFFGPGTKEAIAWAREREADLLQGRIAKLFDSLEALRRQAQQAHDAASAQAKQAGEKLVTLVEKEITYFRNNEARINYADFLARGFLIGSGAMEGSCRHHVKERIDRGGQQWSPSGAMAVLRNRTLIKNGDWDDFWTDEAQRRWRRYEQLNAALTA
jgi:hypothetical protein